MPCPSASEIQQAQSGLLAADRTAEILAHVGTCGQCGQLLKSPETTFLNLADVADRRGLPDGVETGRPGEFDPRETADLSGGPPVDSGAGPDAKSPDPDLTGNLSSIDFDSGNPLPADAPVVSALGSKRGLHPASTATLEISSEIARGGMGAVLYGHDTSLHRDVAVKVLLENHQGKTELLQRFVEEAQIHGQLQHPGVAPVYQVGEFADKRPYFTMKLVKGKTLAKLLAGRSDPLEDRPRFLGIFEQVCQTLAYAHSRKVIHRDLKPANIMVGAFGEVQVMDWGLAKVMSETTTTDSESPPRDVPEVISVIRTVRSGGSSVDGGSGTGSQTQAGSVLGTPAYMPPEQALGEVDRLDERADVFGLGAILCEILTGKPPYVGTDGGHIWRKATRADLGDAFERLDNCSADAALVSLTRQCLSAEPADRPRDAQGLANALRAYQEGVQDKLRVAELARVEAQARVEEEAKRRVLSDQLATEALARAQADNKRRRMTFALVASLLLTALVAVGALLWFQNREAIVAQREVLKQTQEAALERQRNDELVKLNQRIESESRAAKLQSNLSQDVSYRAKRHQERAESEALRARATALAVRSQQLRSVHDRSALGLAIEAVSTTTRFGQPAMVAALQALRDELSTRRGRPITDGDWIATKVTASPNGRWLAAANGEGPGRLWDLLKAAPPAAGSKFGESDEKISEIAFSKDNNWLFTVNTLGDATLFSLTSSEPTVGVARWNVATPQFDGYCGRIEFSADGRQVAVVWQHAEWRGNDLTVQVVCSCLRLDPADPLQIVLTVPPSTQGWEAPAFSAAGKWITLNHSRHNKATFLIWNTQISEQDPVVIHSHRLPYGNFEPKISRDERWLAFIDSEAGLQLYDLEASDPISSQRMLMPAVSIPTKVLGLESAIFEDAPFEFSPNSRWLIAGGPTGQTFLWNLKSKVERITLMPPPSTAVANSAAPINTLLLPGNGRWLVARAIAPKSL
ncbi:MAG: protein kinase [Planctomycetota bacterium]|nr:protein kinase [Planctomycetota bacterium]